ncbi:hypothetical protein Fmac_027132 [Flemingia macrophylla]|uniref:Disease resistance N-terminal domain-containing protein n=1 Tax=Flemingia macrophylla TaxID=520843 RepID=A0ABD1LGT7_9FABA
MAETAVSLAGQHLLPKFLEAVNMLKDLPNEVADFTDELEIFQDFINGADKVAEAEEDGSRRDRIKKRVMRLREASFRMEDIIDKYMICEEKQPDDLGCAALPCEAVEFIKTLILRIQIAYQIQDVKSVVRKERDGFNRVFPVEEIPNNPRGDKHVSWDRHRMAPLYTEEDKAERSPKEVEDVTDELESFQDFINGADKVAEAEEDCGRRDRIKIAQLIWIIKHRKNNTDKHQARSI